MRSFSLLCLLTMISGLAHAQVPAIPSTEKARVVVLTDVANEPDDEQSFIRLLLYSNELDIECIAATTSVRLQDAIHPEKLYERVEAYREVYPNLRLHAEPSSPSARRRSRYGSLAASEELHTSSYPARTMAFPRSRGIGESSSPRTEKSSRARSYQPRPAIGWRAGTGPNRVDDMIMSYRNESH